MKFTSKVSAALVSLGLLTAASAQDPVKFTVPGVSAPASTPAAPAKAPAVPAKAPAASAATPAAPAAAPVKFTEAQLMETFGYIFILQSGLANQMEAMEFTPAHKEAMVRGINLALTNKELPYDPQQIQAQLKEFMAAKQQVFEAKRQAYLDKLKMQNLADSNAFFTKLKENKNVVELSSGLRYEILKPATGPAPKPGQVATIHYTGSFVSGDVFDSSIERKEPLDILMVVATAENPTGTIPGIFEGLQKVGVGGKAKFYIPPSLAYGDNGNQGIPPGATLVFEVEVLGVKDAPKAAK